MSSLPCQLDTRFSAAARHRPEYRPDDATIRSTIARDLAALDPWRRRRYQARLSRLLREAEDRRQADGLASSRRTAGRLLLALVGMTAAVAFAGAAWTNAEPFALRVALAAAALCAGLLGLDAAIRASAKRDGDLMTQPSDVALALHRQAYESLTYATDLGASPLRGRRA